MIGFQTPPPPLIGFPTTPPPPEWKAQMQYLGFFDGLYWYIIKERGNEMDEAKDETRKEVEEPKKYRDFDVQVGMAGFRVVIGCAELYFSTAKELEKAITRYLRDPVGEEMDYNAKSHRYLRSQDTTYMPGPTVEFGGKRT